MTIIRRTDQAKRRPGAGRLVRLIVCAALLAAIGCNAPGPMPHPGDSKRLDQLRKTYRDLDSGRFLVVADFESAGQEQLFHMVGTDGHDVADQPMIDVVRAREETGVGGLKVTIAPDDAALVLDGTRSTDRALLRDWRAYTLLIFAVRGTGEAGVLTLEIRSGDSPGLVWSSQIKLTPSWRTERIDLASVAEKVDIADVRSVTLKRAASAARAPTTMPAEPLTFHLDDVVLADNSKLLGGEPQKSGTLNVMQRGRRLVVESFGRFTLTFVDGFIIDWRGEPNGPNLADRGGLGPWPVPLQAGWQDRKGQPVVYDDPEIAPIWGDELIVHQVVNEATAARVKIAGQWIDRATTPDGGEQRSWSYTIYPDGRMFVLSGAEMKTSKPLLTRAGWAIGLDGRAGFDRAKSVPVSDGGTGMVLGRAGADLVWMCRSARSAQVGVHERIDHRGEYVTVDGRRHAVVVGDVPLGASQLSHQMFRIWPGDLDDDFAAGRIVEDFASPAQITMLNGESEGFDYSNGWFVLTPAKGVVRFYYDPGGKIRIDPVFLVLNSQDCDAWVYTDGRSVAQVARDYQNQLFFTLQGVQRTRGLIEVHLAKSAASKTATSRPAVGK